MIKKLRLLKYYLSNLKKDIFLTFFLALVSTVSKLMIPYLAGQLINKIILEGFNFGSISIYLYLMASFLIVGSLTRYAFDALSGRLSHKVAKKIREEVSDAYLTLPISYLDKHTNGDMLLRLLNDSENVTNGLVLGGTALFDGVVAIIVTTIMMFSLNWLLGLATVVLTPLSLLTSRFVSRFNAKHFKGQAKNAGKLSGFISESLSNSEVVRTLGIAKDRAEIFATTSDTYRKDVFKASFGASLINPATRLINGIINAILITLGAIIIAGNINLGIVFGIGDLTAFLVYAANYMDPFNEVSDVMAEMSFALASLERIESMRQEERVSKDGLPLNKEVSLIEAKDLTFSYEEGKPILKKVNLTLERGKRIALVGPTGCGKTTLIQVLMRFYDSDSGDFIFDGIEGKKISRESISSSVGMVLQNTWIFTGSVKENIAYGSDVIDEEKVINAAKAALADEMIRRLPNGYETIISDNSGLSLGEKQLICVARAFYKKPEIIVLDEATSSIDIRTESILNNSFDNLMKGKTSLVVAHRLSTIVASDKIYYLKDGEILESGTHEELLAKGGFYYDLYMSQFSHGDDMK